MLQTEVAQTSFTRWMIKQMVLENEIIIQQ